MVKITESLLDKLFGIVGAVFITNGIIVYLPQMEAFWLIVFGIILIAIGTKINGR